jgi:hypothetical protein
MILLWTESHLGHSNRRCSKPMGSGLMRASIMRDVQCRQRSRSMGASDGPTEVRVCANDASLCWAGALPDAQSMIDADEGR